MYKGVAKILVREHIRVETFERIVKIAEMLALGYRQREIAKELGISQPAVSSLLKKLRRIVNNGGGRIILKEICKEVSRK